MLGLASCVLFFLGTAYEFFCMKTAKNEPLKPPDQPLNQKIDLAYQDDLLRYDFNEFSWPDPTPSDRGEFWLFDLFTPPQISVSNGVFSASLPQLHSENLDLTVTSISRQQYKIQFFGYFQKPAGFGDNNKFTLILYDITKDQSFRCEVGDELTDKNISIIGFKEKFSSADPLLKNKPMVTIYDKDLAKNIELSSHTKFYDDRYTIVIKSGTSAKSYTINKINDSISLDGISYSLTEVNMDAGYIKLTQTGGDGHESAKIIRVIGLADNTLQNEPRQKQPIIDGPDRK
ncbi:MAG: hypothetical protein LBB20_01315 [Puniceicoccales bacterium]|jgi:hypothetical protein|nr:hypothetical protein [Puniceicoccales bacterium]